MDKHIFSSVWEYLFILGNSKNLFKKNLMFYHFFNYESDWVSFPVY